MGKTKLCKHCQTEISKKAKVCPNCRKKQGGILKWILITGVVVILASAGIGGEQEAPKKVIDEKVENTGKVEDTIKEDTSIPKEFQSALNKAETYCSMMHMSKKGVYHQLTSEYGEKFSEEAANYAMDNLKVDWKENALKSAENYSKTMHMSKAGIYDQLVSEHGEQFTEEEAQFAIDHLKADYKENALKKAESYLKMDMSPAAIKDQLVSEYGEQFTEEEAQYAVDHLK